MIALVSVDFDGGGSMCGIGRTPMDAHLVEACAFQSIVITVSSAS
jgi:hypothetical protein